MVQRPGRVVVLALAFLLAACAAQVATPRPSDSPSASATPTATPRPTNAVSDVVYLRSVGPGGVANILAIDARTGATLRTLPDGSASSDRSTLLAAEEANGATNTLVRRLDLGSGHELGSFMLDGTYHALWTDGGQTALSRDGHHLALSIYHIRRMEPGSPASGSSTPIPAPPRRPSTSRVSRRSGLSRCHRTVVLSSSISSARA